MNIVNKCEMDYKLSGNPRLLVELTLLNLSYTGTEKKNNSPEHGEQPEVKTETPVVQKKNEPAPIPEAPKSISLKNMLSEIKKEKEKEVVETADVVAENTFTEEKLIREWKIYAESIKVQLPRLSSRLLEYSPKLVSEQLVHYPVISEQHIEQMKMRSTDLINHLKKTLSASITVEWIVQEVNTESDGKTRLYTPKDKIEYIISVNSAIDNIIKDLDLDYR
jgi:DNA polymerase III gamma/tau subunit